MKLFRLKSNPTTIVKVDETFKHPDKGFFRVNVFWSKTMENGPSCQWIISTQHERNLQSLTPEETQEVIEKVEDYKKRFDSVNVRL